MIKPENYSQCPELIPARCYKASQRVIYTDAYQTEHEALERCFDKARAISPEAFDLLNKALGHKDAITFMFEEASYLQGFHDVLDLVGRGRLD